MYREACDLHDHFYAEDALADKINEFEGTLGPGVGQWPIERERKTVDDNYDEHRGVKAPMCDYSMQPRAISCDEPPAAANFVTFHLFS